MESQFSFAKDEEYNSAKLYFLNIVNSIIIAEGELLPRSLRTRNLEADFDELWGEYIQMKKLKDANKGLIPEADQNKENGQSNKKTTQRNIEMLTESILRKPFHCNNKK
uniref:Uncharacterized protein n=1 Tax=Parastrongyloides trichosuri TaxID=131310 RepID=A0A0N4Z371_PARTI